MRRQGLSVVEGGYRSGKTTTAVALVKKFFETAEKVKIQREEAKKAKKVKTYSIKELLDNDSSDDEGYKYDVKKS
jgi:thymidylate kinase